MCGNKELGIIFYQIVDRHKQGQQPVRGECGLRLVKNIEAVPLKTIGYERQKRLPVRLFVERNTAVTEKIAVLIQIRCRVVEVFSTQKETVLRISGLYGRYELMKVRM